MKKLFHWMMAAILFCGPMVFTSCSNDDEETIVPSTKNYFTLWNSCEALTALQAYVKDVTNPASPNYIKEEDLAVLAEWRKDPSNWRNDLK